MTDSTHNDNIQVSVNGTITQLAPQATLASLVQIHNPDGLPVAVAVNDEFVPRSQDTATLLTAGDTIDIVSPVGGG